MKIQNVLTFAKDNSVKTVDLKFSNLFGGWHHIVLPIERLNENLFIRGIGIDGSSIPGFKLVGSSDCYIIPDPDTMFLDPFFDKTTLSMICSVYRAGTKEPYPLDPRQVALRSEAYLKEKDYADFSLWGPELEFYIFDGISFVNEMNHSCYRIESSEVNWMNYDGCSPCGSGTFNPIKGAYHAAPPRDKHCNVRERMSYILQSVGVPVKYHHHEVGGAGQAEIETELAPLAFSGDYSMLIKYVCKMVAQSEGIAVTFMPKPLYNEAGSGMHFHQQLFKGDNPVFYSESDPFGLSDIAYYYIGGLLKHGSALLGLTNPSTNSYKRLIPGFEAPVNAMFGIGNRSAAVRVPAYAESPDRKRFEFRPPDATCNAYIAMAAQLMAGLDGIENKIDPRELGMGPFDKDVLELTPEEASKIKSLPSSLESALTALEEDHEFLLKGNVFPKELINNWIERKRKQEDIQVRLRPHPYEMFLYFDV